MRRGIPRRSVLIGAATVPLAATGLAGTATGHAGAATAATGTASPATPAAKRPKVLVIGLDGAMLHRIRDAEAPHLKRLMADGLAAPSSLYTAPMARTESGPGWSTVLTGVWPDKHKVRDNSFSGADLGTYPDFLTYVEREKPALRTYAVASWGPIPDTIISGEVDDKVATPGEEYDAGTTERAVAQLRDGQPDALFLQLDNVDHAGHESGGASQEYLDALAGVDAQVGELLAAVEGRPSYGEEDWLIMVTADHGHTDAGGHGGSDWNERQTFVIANGPGIAAGSERDDVRLVDVAATALAHLGIEADPAWKLDGVPLGEKVADAFDSVRGELEKAVDETGIAPSVLGWTHTAPDGWKVDNARMGGGGVTEWRGWSFTTDAFWTRTQADQRRELNVRSRGVFAVADPDEWADGQDTEGTFDSTLVSPAWKVTGGTTATLSFVSHYLHDPGQTAQVLVAYDDGEPRTVKTYGADAVARHEKLTLDVPAGASSARVSFRCAGDNTWFWALDAVRLG
ncbi:alkaline phosphatase family protein [Streptomyces iconiensis]|uniref:Alkaline phosphatase family protein n=1 Tax=Streptomyces iconiensis TaxID=1384038 RepID=A0ABT6ZWR2_9ACTN|nr:alkaline phosphatase family protein [Streptomyces iconiensis]MDJ1133272.1 alkaline phosphatase family protein [Streptomyces iconiensis]